MRCTYLGSAALAALFVFGCSEQGEAVDRGPIGKADLYGSCADSMDPTFSYCGGQSDGNCWCDEMCEWIGDCCEDKAAVCDGLNACVAAGGTCEPLIPAGCPQGSQPAAHSCGGMLGVMCCTECPPVMCYLYCEHGFKKDEHGCEICECEDPQEKQCGGLLGLMCDATEYCDYPEDSCGYADQMGVCKPRPQMCYELYAPVCGCNGETYSNDCYAHGAGTDVKSQGPCCPPNALCGIYCEFGYKKDENGCELCECEDPPEPARVIASGYCVRNGLEACTEDADCATGGCGGELCYNPDFGGGITTCDCTSPSGVEGCGCVNGFCAWYNYAW